MRTVRMILIIRIAVVLIILLVTSSAHAALNVDISNITSPDTAATDEGIADYIVRLYWFAVGAAGAVAVAYIVGGAIYYMVSSGSPDKQNEAKSYITSALWGVALLLGSYFILNTVNPQITALKPPGGGKSCDEVSDPKPGINCMPSVPQALPVCEGDVVRTGGRTESGDAETVPAQPGINCMPACAPDERACGIGEEKGQTRFGEKPCVKCVYSPYVAPEGVGCTPSCFFDPEKEGSAAFLDPNDSSAVGTVIDKKTAACQPGNPKRIAPCVCVNCQPITGGFIPVKQENTCVSDGGSNKCFLEEGTLAKLKKTISSWKNIDIASYFSLTKWRITEAFPPVANHLSRQHYNGRAFDIAPADKSLCGKAIDIAKAFSEAGFTAVLIEGPVGSCPGISDKDGEIFAPGVLREVNNAAFHIHVQN